MLGRRSSPQANEMRNDANTMQMTARAGILNIIRIRYCFSLFLVEFAQRITHCFEHRRVILGVVVQLEE